MQFTGFEAARVCALQPARMDGFTIAIADYSAYALAVKFAEGATTSPGSTYLALPVNFQGEAYAE